MKNIEIAGRKIGGSSPCFIIAEAGINHNGDINIAKKMVDAAKECGVDAIKFQTFKADEFVSDKDQLYTYETQGRKVTESMRQMFKRYEFGAKEFRVLNDHCKKRGIIFFSTPQNTSDLDLLLKLNVPAIKVGSDDLTNLPLLRSYAKKKLPLLISTGMADLAELAEAVQAIEEFNDKLAIFLCVSSYPAGDEELNLNRLKTMRLAFPQAVIGYSDHALGVISAVGAVTLGAKLIEKHFTLDRTMHGPDQQLSSDPAELKEYVKAIRTIEKAMGSSEFRPSIKEQQMRAVCRRSIVAKRNMRKGSTLNEKDLVFKRPGNGILPKYMHYVVGRKTKKHILKDQIIKLEDLS